MKNYKQTIYGLALMVVSAFTLGSCSDFLMIEPKSTISEDNFWNEKTDIDQIVAGIYIKMQEQAFIERCIVWGEVRSDNTEGLLNLASEDLNLYRVINEQLQATNYYTVWTDFYSVINKCNIVIERAPEVAEKDPSFKNGDLQATIAEMKAIRALCYFYLVRTFRDVPFNTAAVQSEDDVTSLPATPGDEIVTALIADLEACKRDARTNYPKLSSRDNPDIRCNRITRTAIYALLTDLYIWMADDAHPGYYTKAVECADSVIKYKVQQYLESDDLAAVGSSVRLMDNNASEFIPYGTYSKAAVPGIPLYYNIAPPTSGESAGACNVFNMIFGQKNSFESIFELDYNAKTRDDNNYLQNVAVARLYGNGYGKDYGNAKAGSKSKYFGVNSGVVNSLDRKNGGVADPKTCFTSYKDARYHVDLNIEGDGNQIDAFVSKYVHVSASAGMNGKLIKVSREASKDNCNRNWIFYRLTDIMLLQAEALVELGGDEVTTWQTVQDEDGNDVKKKVTDPNLARAFHLVWAVNRRSLMSSYTAKENDELKLTDYPTKDQLRELVQDERRRELMFEGKRWFDLLRRCHREGNTKYICDKVKSKSSNGGSMSLFRNPESLYWPYNRREVINNINLDQKPFYGNDEDKGYQSTVN